MPDNTKIQDGNIDSLIKDFYAKYEPERYSDEQVAKVKDFYKGNTDLLIKDFYAKYEPERYSDEQVLKLNSFYNLKKKEQPTMAQAMGQRGDISKGVSAGFEALKGSQEQRSGLPLPTINEQDPLKGIYKKPQDYKAQSPVGGLIDNNYSGEKFNPSTGEINEIDQSKRQDGTTKDVGFLGELKLPNGGVATEYSIGVELNGKEIEIPTLVPTLTQEEIDLMVNDIIPNGKMPPKEIADKAIDFAKQRIKNGMSPFATIIESNVGSKPTKNLYSEMKMPVTQDPITGQVKGTTFDPSTGFAQVDISGLSEEEFVTKTKEDLDKLAEFKSANTVGKFKLQQESIDNVIEEIDPKLQKLLDRTNYLIDYSDELRFKVNRAERWGSPDYEKLKNEYDSVINERKSLNEQLQKIKSQRDNLEQTKDLLRISEKLLNASIEGSELNKIGKALTTPLAKDYFSFGINEMVREFGVLDIYQKNKEIEGSIETELKPIISSIDEKSNKYETLKSAVDKSKTEIDGLKTQYESKASELDKIKKELESIDKTKNQDLYNKKVNEYNNKLKELDPIELKYKTASVSYNTSANRLNEIAGELTDLQKTYTDKYNKLPKLTDEEQQLLSAYEMLGKVRSNTSGDLTLDVAKGVSEMLPYMVQFIGTGGLASGAEASVKKGVESLIKKGVKGQVAKSMLKYAPKAIGYTAGAVARVPVMPMTYKETATGQIQGKDVKEALLDAGLTTFAEVFTEGLGGHGGKVLAKIEKKGIAPKMFETLKKIESKNPEVVKKLSESGAWNGVVGEYSEELINSYMQAGLTGDKKLKDVWDGREQLTTLLTVAAFGSIVKAPALLKTVNEEKESALEKVPDSIKEEVQKIDNLKTVDEKAEAVNTILKNNELDEEEVKSVLDYAKKSTEEETIKEETTDAKKQQGGTMRLESTEERKVESVSDKDLSDIDRTELQDREKEQVEVAKEPKVGDKVELPPKVKGGLAVEMEYTEEGWKQKVGRELVGVSKGQQEKAQDKFTGQVAEETKKEIVEPIKEKTDEKAKLQAQGTEQVKAIDEAKTEVKPKEELLKEEQYPSLTKKELRRKRKQKQAVDKVNEGAKKRLMGSLKFAKTDKDVDPWYIEYVSNDLKILDENPIEYWKNERRIAEDDLETNKDSFEVKYDLDRANKQIEYYESLKTEDNKVAETVSEQEQKSLTEIDTKLEKLRKKTPSNFKKDGTLKSNATTKTSNEYNALMDERNKIEGEGKYKSYEEWSNSAKVKENIPVSRTMNRAIYDLPNGDTLMVDEVIPHNVFKKSFEIASTDIVLKVTKENEELVKKYGGRLDEEYGYAAAGYGYAVFSNHDNDIDSEKQAYLFSLDNYDRFKKEFEQEQEKSKSLIVEKIEAKTEETKPEPPSREAVKQFKKEEAKKLASEALEDLMKLTGGLKSLTGEEKVKLIETIKKLSKAIQLELEVAGMELVDAVKKFIKDNNINISDKDVEEALGEKVEKKEKEGKQEFRQYTLTKRELADPDVPLDFKEALIKSGVQYGVRSFSMTKEEARMWFDLAMREEDIDYIVQTILNDKGKWHLDTKSRVIQLARDYVLSESKSKTITKEQRDKLRQQYVDLTNFYQRFQQQAGGAVASFNEEKGKVPQTPEEFVEAVKKSYDNYNESILRSKYGITENTIYDLKDLIENNPEIKEAILTEAQKISEEVIPKDVREKWNKWADTVEGWSKEFEGVAFGTVVPPQVITGMLKIASKALRVAGSVEYAVKEAIKYVKQTDWYKSLTDQQKANAEKSLSDKLNSKFKKDIPESLKKIELKKKPTSRKKEKTEAEKEAKALEKIKEKLAQLNDEQIKKFIYESLDEYIAKGYITDEDIRRHLAKSLELSELTDQEIEKIKSLAEIANSVEEKLMKFADSEKSEDFKEYVKATRKAYKAKRDLDRMFVQKPELSKVIISLIQGNLLTPKSQIVNVVAYPLIAPLRMPQQLLTSAVIHTLATIGKIGNLAKRVGESKNTAIRWLNKNNRFVNIISPNVTYDYIKGKNDYFRTMPRAIRDAVFQSWYGQTDMKKYDVAFKLDTKKAWKELIKDIKNITKGKVELKKTMIDGLQAIFGGNSEVMLRMLALADTPIRLTKQFEILGSMAKNNPDMVKSIHERRVFMENPMVWYEKFGKDREDSKRFAEEAVDFAKQEAEESAYMASVLGEDKKTGARITVSGTISKALDWVIDKKIKSERIKEPLKGFRDVLLKLVITYETTPLNIVREVFRFAAPEFMVAKSALAISRGDRLEFSKSAGYAMVGFMFRYVAMELLMKGLVSQSIPYNDDDDKKLRRNAYQPGGIKPATINITAIRRGIATGNWDTKDDDTWVSYKRFGVFGIVLGINTRLLTDTKHITPEVTPTTAALKSLSLTMTESFDQSFMAGSNSILLALQGDEFEQRRALSSLTNTSSSIFVPSNVAYLSKAATLKQNQMAESRGLDGKEDLKVMFKNKMFQYGEGGKKVNVWGEPVPLTENKGSEVSKFLSVMFGIGDAYERNFDHVGYDLFNKSMDILEEGSKKEATSLIPSQPSRTVRNNNLSVKLPNNLYERYQIKIGEARFNALNDYNLEKPIKERSSEELITELPKIYEKAYSQAKLEFITENAEELNKLWAKQNENIKQSMTKKESQFSDDKKKKNKNKRKGRN